jgi:hypothetical protein
MARIVAPRDGVPRTRRAFFVAAAAPAVRRLAPAKAVITNYLFVGLPEGAGAHLRDDLVLTRVCERRSLSLS